MAQADAEEDDDGSQVTLTSPEKKELAELRRKNRQPEMENEILKQRAAAYFCPGENPPKVAFRLVRELAGGGTPMAVGWALQVSTSGYYEWLGRLSHREKRVTGS